MSRLSGNAPRWGLDKAAMLGGGLCRNPDPQSNRPPPNLRCCLDRVPLLALVYAAASYPSDSTWLTGELWLANSARDTRKILGCVCQRRRIKKGYRSRLRFSGQRESRGKL